VNKDAPYLDAIFIVALVLVLVRLIGLHAQQKENYGRIGQAGFYTVVKASFVQILGLVVLLLGSAVLEWLIPIGSLAVLVRFCSTAQPPCRQGCWHAGAVWGSSSGYP